MKVEINKVKIGKMIPTIKTKLVEISREIAKIRLVIEF